MNVHIYPSKEGLIASINDFLEALPADTKSVQCVLYAYTDDYENYSDKTTKCVAETDLWYNLSEEEQMELLGESVTACLKQLVKVITAPSETEEEVLARDEGLTLVKGALKALARSFVIYLENIDTASMAGEQLIRLFDGILGHNDRQIFSVAFDIFRKKKALEPMMEELQWKLLSGKTAKAKGTAVGAPIGKPKIPAAKPDETDAKKAAAPKQGAA